jgi:transposase-like protein
MSDAPKHPGGRPTDYDTEYCDKAETFLADGYSVAALAGFLGVAKSTIYEWIDRHPEFSDSVKRGQAGAVYWWEKANRNLAMTGEGNATACVFGLKNRASDEWRDKVETEHSGNVSFEAIEWRVKRPAD